MYDLPSQTGKNIIITGSNSGLGKQAALRLATAGAQVILAVRNISKGNQAKDEIMRACPQAVVAVEELDISYLPSVASFVERMKMRGVPIDVLINNAGVMAPPTRHVTQEGFELQFATNYLGHFALTYQLLPLLLKAARPRVVTVSSIAALWGKVRIDDLQYIQRRYIPVFAYGQSKLADAMLAVQLARMSDEQHWNLISVGAHPGMTRTNLQYAGTNLDGKRGVNGRFFDISYVLRSQDVAAGVEPILMAATDPHVRNNDYFGPNGILHMTGEPARVALPPRTKNKEIVEKLFQESLRLTGLNMESITSPIMPE